MGIKVRVPAVKQMLLLIDTRIWALLRELNLKKCEISEIKFHANISTFTGTVIPQDLPKATHLMWSQNFLEIKMALLERECCIKSYVLNYTM